MANAFDDQDFRGGVDGAEAFDDPVEDGQGNGDGGGVAEVRFDEDAAGTVGTVGSGGAAGGGR